ncbi:hypothetical protein JS533_001650 [Bifidobacterium amazonense]|uniref:Uncharacterized protein n=1 Tax=Bifidobacterium amazonense TaxID=2809027 RepID=A0ABS9VSD8_9BIFI|nr:hypothetical protein [Bifidobacterium amazonense]MCH9274993.1 hypothetical protein [Bifidobacterium amazonense]
MANLFDIQERYTSMQSYYASDEFAKEPADEVFACYELEFGEGINHFNDPNNPKNDEEAKQMAIECLIAGKPRPWADIPESAVI